MSVSLSEALQRLQVGSQLQPNGSSNLPHLPAENKEETQIVIRKFSLKSEGRFLKAAAAAVELER